MPAAQIQFSQGLTTGGVGQSILGFTTGTQVNFTDAAGAGATSWAWTIVGFPGPLTSAPTINNAATQTGNISSPSSDGVYLIKVVRTDPGPVVTTDVRFFAIGDADYGFYLPSAGMTGNMTNIAGSLIAQNAGWEGTAAAPTSTNFFLDALLRFLRSRVGRFLGLQATSNNTSSSPTTVTLVDGVDKPYQILNLQASGTGLWTSQQASTGPVPPQGKVFRYQVDITAASGGLNILNGVGGSVILALVAPPSGTTTYEVETVFNGSNWFVSRVAVPDPKALWKSNELVLVGAVQTNNTQVFLRAGNRQIDPTQYPANVQAVFSAVVATSSVLVPVVIQLYDLTAGAVVTASPVFPIQSSVLAPTLLTTTVTLPSASHLYEVQFKMGAAGIGTDIVAVSYAAVTFTWG